MRTEYPDSNIESLLSLEFLKDENQSENLQKCRQMKSINLLVKRFRIQFKLQYPKECKNSVFLASNDQYLLTAQIGLNLQNHQKLIKLYLSAAR